MVEKSGMSWRSQAQLSNILGFNVGYCEFLGFNITKQVIRFRRFSTAVFAIGIPRSRPKGISKTPSLSLAA
jgi:hypothetical protein